MLEVGDFINHVLENNLEALQPFQSEITKEYLEFKIQHLSNLNVLQISCVRNYFSLFQFLLLCYDSTNLQEQLKYILQSIDDDQRTLLFYSCLEGHEELTLFILDFLIANASQEQITSHLLCTTKDAKYTLNRNIFLFLSGGRTILHALVERNSNISFVQQVKQKIIQIDDNLWNQLIWKRDFDLHTPLELFHQTEAMSASTLARELEEAIEAEEDFDEDAEIQQADSKTVYSFNTLKQAYADAGINGGGSADGEGVLLTDEKAQQPPVVAKRVGNSATSMTATAAVLLVAGALLL